MRTDTDRLNWIEECGQEIHHTFERHDAWSVVDVTREAVAYPHEITTYGDTLREAIDRAMDGDEAARARRGAPLT